MRHYHFVSDTQFVDTDGYCERYTRVESFRHPTKRNRLRCRECGGLMLDSTWMIDGLCASCDARVDQGG